MDIDTGFLLGLLKAAVGLGLVIFVHELGHFLVARLCGVKCEKFYVGFDFFGLSIFKFQMGETLYGLGIFPLGGYVKMLGQDDNPANAAEEAQRARANDGTGPEECTTEELDPRSYMAQSVGERMAIISAGVVMNIIFAVIFAVGAYRMGVQNLACGVRAVTPGHGAWRAGMLPGDDILQVGEGDSGRRADFVRDLASNVMLGNVEKGVRLKIKRRGVKEPFWITAYPDTGSDRPTIGAIPPRDTLLIKKTPTLKHFPAGSGSFEGGDRIVAIDGSEIKTYADVVAALTAHKSEAIEVTVERKNEDSEAPESDTETPPPAQRVTIEVQPTPLKRLGLVMKPLPVMAIQAASPAETAGIKPGDVILSIDGQPMGDPITLADRLKKRAGDTISLRINREKDEEATELTIDLTLRDPWWFELPETPNDPISIPTMGIAFPVDNTIEAIIPDSPAEAAGLAQGDQVTLARIFPASETEAKKEQKLIGSLRPIEFESTQRNWPFFVYQVLQHIQPDSEIVLTVVSGTKQRTVKLKPKAEPGYFYPERGFNFKMLTFIRRAKSLGEAIPLGLLETKKAMSQVYVFLNKLASQQIGTNQLGGPGMIIYAAGSSAQAGLPELLIFLTMLSANLAVVNFLPIPVLDGGHMVFLVYEAIFGKPPSDRIVVTLSYMGLFLILGLMLYVTGLDIARLTDWLRG